MEVSLSVYVPVEIDDVAASMNFYARRPMTVTDQLVSASSGFARQVADSMAAVEEYRATATLAHHLGEAMQSELGLLGTGDASVRGHKSVVCTVAGEVD